MFLGILLLAIALLVLYFESKFREQNHKISSMLSLVSSLAEEIDTNKMMINHLSMVGSGHVISQNINNTYDKMNVEQNQNTPVELIDVSDDDDDADDADDEDEDEDEDGESSESEDEKSLHDNLEEKHVIQIHEQSHVKVLKIDIDENVNDDEIEDIDNNSDNMDIINDIDELVSCDSESTNNNLEEKLKVSAPLYHMNDEFEKHSISNEGSISVFDLKSINISTLEEPKGVLDFKKLSLNKLRSIVSDKGLSTDASKLKKPDLLKLLGSE